MADTKALTLEAAIAAAAGLANNPHASSHLNAAHARLIEAVIKNAPPSFTLFTPADVFAHDAPEYLQNILRAVDDVIHTIADEANRNAPGNISTKDRMSLCSDALSDNGLVSDLQEAAADMRESAMEAAE